MNTVFACKCTWLHLCVCPVFEHTLYLHGNTKSPIRSKAIYLEAGACICIIADVSNDERPGFLHYSPPGVKSDRRLALGLSKAVCTKPSIWSGTRFSFCPFLASTCERKSTMFLALGHCVITTMEHAPEHYKIGCEFNSSLVAGKTLC